MRSAGRRVNDWDPLLVIRSRRRCRNPNRNADAGMKPCLGRQTVDDWSNALGCAIHGLATEATEYMPIKYWCCINHSHTAEQPADRPSKECRRHDCPSMQPNVQA